MTAQTGRIDAAFGWSGHRLREGRGASCRGGWRHPERGVARAELRDGHPPRRRDYTYPRWRNQYGGLKADDAKGRSGQVRPLGTGHAGANRRRNAPARRTTNWSLRRFQRLRSCAQEIECSPQRRVALGISQHSTDSLTFLVAEDFPRARFALDHCASNRHRDVGQALLSKPPREFLDLFRGA